MRSLLAFAFGFIVFAITTTILFLGRHDLDHTPFLLTIVGGYLISLAALFPADMNKARDTLTGWYTAWKASK